MYLYETLFIGMKPCVSIWNPVYRYETLCIGMKPCVLVWNPAYRYETLFISMKLCVSCWNYVSVWNPVYRYETMCIGIKTLCVVMKPCLDTILSIGVKPCILIRNPISLRDLPSEWNHVFGRIPLLYRFETLYWK